MAPKTKIIGGETYHTVYPGGAHDKAEAEATKGLLKHNGLKVRVYKVGKKYFVYSTRK